MIRDIMTEKLAMCSGDERLLCHLLINENEDLKRRMYKMQKVIVEYQRMVRTYREKNKTTCGPHRN